MMVAARQGREKDIGFDISSDIFRPPKQNRPIPAFVEKIIKNTHKRVCFFFAHSVHNIRKTIRLVEYIKVT